MNGLLPYGNSPNRMVAGTGGVQPDQGNIAVHLTALRALAGGAPDRTRQTAGHRQDPR